ncbi:hypothetical protein ILYODFUR_023234 [Ilyodon furcidens]|uniref:Uncharacterized protein n=1 Tax=Ilyodon furcidens TaxID=33524 RepID=A0ABV0TBJ7_9TELE
MEKPGKSWKPPRLARVEQGFFCLTGSTADLHGFTKCSSGFCPSVAGLLIACPLVVGLLIAGSARDGHRSVHLNPGSAGEGLRARRLNSWPPSEAPSAHPGRVVLLFNLPNANI